MKRILTYALLLSFAVVLSPRSIWHTHENEKDQAVLKFTHSENEFHPEDCFVCDFSLSLFTVHKEFSFNKYAGKVVPKPFPQVFFVHNDIDLCLSQRGPPSLV